MLKLFKKNIDFNYVVEKKKYWWLVMSYCLCCFYLNLGI